MGWDDDCNYCMSNPFTLEAIEIEKNLPKDKELVVEYLDKEKELDSEIKKMSKIRAFKEELDNAKLQLTEGKLREDNLNYSLQYINEI